MMEQMRRRKTATPAQAKRGDDFLGEIVGYATDAGIVPVTRAKLYQLCIERGETPAEADASAFGPWTRLLRGDEPGLVLREDDPAGQGWPKMQCQAGLVEPDSRNGRRQYGAARSGGERT